MPKSTKRLFEATEQEIEEASFSTPSEREKENNGGEKRFRDESSFITTNSLPLASSVSADLSKDLCGEKAAAIVTAENVDGQLNGENYEKPYYDPKYYFEWGQKKYFIESD